jgi:hypothetical protein
VRELRLAGGFRDARLARDESAGCCWDVRGGANLVGDYLGRAHRCAASVFVASRRDIIH